MANSMFSNEEKSPQLLVIEQDTMVTYVICGAMIIGRRTKSHNPDVSIISDFVSRRHGIIEVEKGFCYYTDTDSTNGSWLNGIHLKPASKHKLSDRDLIVLYKESLIETSPFVALIYCERGVTKMHRTFAEMIMAGYLSQLTFEIQKNASLNERNLVRFAGIDGYNNEIKKSASSEPFIINIHDKTVSVRGKKIILLKDINLSIPPGSITLILGGSGAGKTTLMNAVMGYEKANGVVKLGSLDVYKDFEAVKPLIGYVPQQDLMRMNDTVYDTLMNSAELKLAQGSVVYRENRVKKTLRTLGLEREQSHLVGKLSGGQRKRLSVAIEYVSDPSLFFLDEPDSGLDGVMARALFRNLRVIADEGKIVMVISHGPDRHEALFDRVLVLAKSAVDNCGRLAFFGTVQDSYLFFNTSSLEEIVQRINRLDEGGDGLADEYIQKFANLQSKMSN